jgi:predicted AlkP superfamily phosphohydrolase/phosphomutase
MPRVAAIGLDAAEWQLIEEMLERGALPNLARIRQNSTECRLRNEEAFPRTPVWDAFLSGMQDPVRATGVGFDPATYQPYKMGACTKPPFYNIFPDIEAIAFDVPNLSLAGSNQDVRICTWGCHSWSYPRSAQPAGLLNEIDARFGPHPAFGKEHDCAWYSPRFINWLTSSLDMGSQRRVAIANWLQHRFPNWDLFLTAMSETHSAGESFGHVLDKNHPLNATPIAALHRESLLRVYQFVDKAVGCFAAGLPADAVLVVFSLHGTTSNNGDLPSMVLLPELLYRLSFRKPLMRDPEQRGWERKGYPVVMLRERWDHYMRACFPDVFPNRLRHSLIRLLPDPLLDGLRTLQSRLAMRQTAGPYRGTTGVTRETEFKPEEIGDARSSLDWQVPCWYRRYWPRMQVFALPTFSDALLRINLRGRERDGIVAPEDYEQVCAGVEDCIAACRDPRSGRPVVEEVIRPQRDPLEPTGPVADIVIRWAKGIDAFEHPDFGVIGPFPFRRTGAHTSRGFAFFSGPGIDRADLGEHRTFDLPATILALLGREPPSNLIGKPLLRACTS